MIRVAFLLNFPLTYKGGINYIKNLFYAIKEVDNRQIEIVLFVPTDITQEYIELFLPYVAEVVKVKFLKRGSFTWFLDKVFQKCFNYGVITDHIIKKNKINIISHSSYVSRYSKIKSINWIPDFQYLHYPGLWPVSQLNNTKKHHKYLAEKSDIIVLSSFDAFKDYKNVYTYLGEKVRVLHFVSQPTSTNSNLGNIDLSLIERYSQGKLFFYLPNQFWAHKNHMLVFKAVKILKSRGYDFLLLTSGVMEDFRNKNDHIKFLKDYVEENHLSETIKFLGVIPYDDVLALMKNSRAVINPSYFEGWSSTVEEARTLGANLLLSDIPVHREQSPPSSQYFNPDQEEELANLMEHHLEFSTKSAADDYALMRSLSERTVAFGNTYLGIVKELLH